MENNYKIKQKEVFDQIGDHAKIVLASSQNNHVSARKMSFLIKDNLFYFQTDKTFHKYQDIKANPYVALCIDNIQIEGICEEIGHPLDNEEFCEQFKIHFLSSFEAYSHLENERLMVIKPTFIQRWSYINGYPIIEQLYINEEKYSELEYTTH